MALWNDYNNRVWKPKPSEHFTLRITSFSSLASEEKYESGEFDAGGYKWKLVLFPNGNKNNGVKDHISLYVKMAGNEPIIPSKIVTISYNMFLLKKHKGQKSYMFRDDSYPEEEKKCCFYRSIIGDLAGFDRFITLEEFNDPSNGYLVNDMCEFGAEVFVNESRPSNIKRELLFMNLTTMKSKYTWNVAHFSCIPSSSIWSGPFILSNQEYCLWNLELYPRGTNDTHDYISLYLWLHSLPPYELPNGSKILAEFTLRIYDQNSIDDNYFQNKTRWFITGADDHSRCCGFDEMITREESALCSVNDSCKIEVEISILGISMPG